MDGTTEVTGADATDTLKRLIQTGTISDDPQDIQVGDGNHSYTMIAICANNSAYNSLPSNAITKSVGTLGAPSISWNPSGSAMLSIAQSSDGKEDFYNVRFTSSGSSTVLSTSNNTRSVKKDSSGTTPFNVYNMANSIGVLQTTNTGSSDTYTVNAFSFSYNDFYYRVGSTGSNTVEYQVIQLAAPTNLSYEISVGKTVLSWTGDPHARAYRIDVYTGSSTNPTLSSSFTTEGNVTSYSITLATGFWQIYITALGSSETNINPIYINSSSSSPLVIGTLQAPVITRNGQYLSWSAVDLANTYKVYNGDTDHEITEIPATSATQITWNMSTLAYSVAGISYNIFVVATAAIDGKTYISSGSNLVSFTRRQLATPTISFNPAASSIAVWTAISDANYYDIFVNSGTSVAPTATVGSGTLTYTMDYSVPNTYDMGIVARNSDTFLFPSSAESNILTYSVIKLTAPSISYDSTESIISWNAVPSADHYKVYLNGTLYATVTELSYDFNLPAGSYGTYVIATNTAQYDPTNKPNPKYIDSDASNTISFGKLETPVLSQSDNIITWPSISNATGYEIYNFGTLLLTINQSSAPSYTIESAVEGSWNITVKAISASSFIESSEMSNAISYNITKLGAPTIALTSDYIVAWNPINGASKYLVYIGGILRVTVTNATSVNIQKYTPSGTRNEIYVIAASDLVRYIKSDPSNSIFKQTLADAEAMIVVDGTDSYDIYYPFSIRESMDETLDTASVTTVPTTICAPFEARKKVRIVISDENGVAFVRQSPQRPFEYIIDSDDVEEVQIGTVAKYKHHLTLIEPTKELENVILPNISITQDLKSVIREYISTANIPAFSNGYIAYTADMNKTTSPSATAGYSCRGLLSPIDSLRKVPEWAVIGSEILLPNDSHDSLFNEKIIQESNISSIHWINYFNGTKPTKGFFKNDGTYVKPEDIANYGPIHRKWYWRYNTDVGTGNYSGTKYAETISEANGYHLIADTTGSGYPSFIFPSNMMIDGKDTKIDIIFVIDGTYTNIYKNQILLNGLITSNRGVDFISGKNLAPYRIEWDGITIKTEAPAANITGITVKNALDHILNVANNKYFKNGKPLSPNHSESNPEYTLDPNLYDTMESTYCPEMVFEKGKSLWDVTLEIGRLIGGIPRLITGKTSDGKDIANVISFDILKNIANSNSDANFGDFIANGDGQEKEETTSQITNHATGYVSQISNMIPKDSYQVYPGSDTWITPRSNKPSDPFVNRSNMSVVLNAPMSRLLSLIVTNFNKNNMSDTVDIIEYVYEKSVYDTLNNDAAGKGTALYWTIGGNSIVGLGYIPETNSEEATWGMQPNDYVIQMILKRIGYSSLADVNDYKYRAIFVPYVNTRVTTEQQNISGLAVPTYLNLNQENNTISDDSFGKSAQTQVMRLGNNSLIKTAKIYSYSNVPNLGTCRFFNGFRYYIDVLNIKFCNTYYEVTAEFSKNWNKINDRVGINSEYRQYEIYGSKWINRDISLNNYCYISTKLYSDAVLSRAKAELVNNISSALIGNPTEQKSMFYVKPLDNNDTPIKYTAHSVGSDNTVTEYTAKTAGLALFASYTTYRNSIMYSSSMIDNFSAGIFAAEEVKNYVTGESLGKYVQKDARYVDDKGQCQRMYITLASPKISEISYGSFDFLGQTVYYGDSIAGATLPLCRDVSNPSTLTGTIFSNKYLIDKDNREALRFSYQLHFLTYDKHISIHSGMTRYLYKQPASAIVTPGTNLFIKRGQLKFARYISYLNESETCPGYGSNYIADASITTYTDDSGKDYIKISPTNFSSSGDILYAGYALVWSGTGEILFNYDFETPHTITSIPDFYMNFTSDKVSYKDDTAA